MDNYINKTDEEIVEVVRNSNKELYALIIERFQPRLIRYATYLLGDLDKATDAVQESFIKAYINLNGFDTKKKFSSWIYRIVHNEVINMINKNKKLITFGQEVDFDTNEDLEEAFDKESLRILAHSCLEQMELKYREPITLYYLEDKTYDEISDILRLPLGTVAIRLKRAKVLMRKICQAKKS